MKSSMTSLILMTGVVGLMPSPAMADDWRAYGQPYGYAWQDDDWHRERTEQLREWNEQRRHLARERADAQRDYQQRQRDAARDWRERQRDLQEREAELSRRFGYGAYGGDYRDPGDYPENYYDGSGFDDHGYAPRHAPAVPPVPYRHESYYRQPYAPHYGYVDGYNPRGAAIGARLGSRLGGIIAGSEGAAIGGQIGARIGGEVD